MFRSLMFGMLSILSEFNYPNPWFKSLRSCSVLLVPWALAMLQLLRMHTELIMPPPFLPLRPMRRITNILQPLDSDINYF